VRIGGVFQAARGLLGFSRRFDLIFYFLVFFLVRHFEILPFVGLRQNPSGFRAQ